MADKFEVLAILSKQVLYLPVPGIHQRHWRHRHKSRIIHQPSHISYITKTATFDRNMLCPQRLPLGNVRPLVPRKCHVKMSFLQRKCHVKIFGNNHGFSNPASDLFIALPPKNKRHHRKFLLDSARSIMFIFLMIKILASFLNKLWTAVVNALGSQCRIG